ncbi:hypothetical protein QO179_24570 [Bacillus stercoris]|nr:hypothetical protein [Bacillus stercoris]
MLRELDGESKLPSKKIAITDEFSVPSSTQEEPKPLYYKAEAKGWFDAKGALVSPYLSGYMENPPEEVLDYAQVDGNEKENLLYLGTKIKITNLDGTDINTNYKYKIHLVREEGEGIPQNAYSIIVYTNFRGNSNETFMLRYEKYNEDGSHTSDYAEVLNAYPFFSQVDKYVLDEIAKNPKLNGEWRPELLLKEFSVEETEDDAYQVYAPSQVLVANNVTRPSHQFKYRVVGNLKTKFSNANPGSINIGIAYLNTSVINVEDLSSTMKKLYEDGYRAPYLDFNNPYPPQLSDLKESVRYWTIDLAMPAEQWNDYDLIIITGYGYYDMSPYGDSIHGYLENGGKLWIDNAGEVGKVLSFKSSTGKETFITNIGFSNETSVTGYKAPEKNSDAEEILNRMYMLGNQTNLKIGYDNGAVSVNPEITFGSGESLNNWTKIVRYSNNKPAIIKRTMYSRGTLFVSNCGIFRSLFYNNENDVKFAINAILTFAENKWIHGPWCQDYVYHRDNLLRKNTRV